MNIISVYCLLGVYYIRLLFVLKCESLHAKNLSLCDRTKIPNCTCAILAGILHIRTEEFEQVISARVKFFLSLFRIWIPVGTCTLFGWIYKISQEEVGKYL